MTTLYFSALVVTYLANGIYFGSKLLASSTARKGRQDKSCASDMQTRCCN